MGKEYAKAQSGFIKVLPCYNRCGVKGMERGEPGTPPVVDVADTSAGSKWSRMVVVYQVLKEFPSKATVLKREKGEEDEGRIVYTLRHKQLAKVLSMVENTRQELQLLLRSMGFIRLYGGTWFTLIPGKARRFLVRAVKQLRQLVEELEAYKETLQDPMARREVDHVIKRVKEHIDSIMVIPAAVPLDILLSHAKEQIREIREELEVLEQKLEEAKTSREKANRRRQIRLKQAALKGLQEELRILARLKQGAPREQARAGEREAIPA